MFSELLSSVQAEYHALYIPMTVRQNIFSRQRGKWRVGKDEGRLDKSGRGEGHEQHKRVMCVSCACSIASSLMSHSYIFQYLLYPDPEPREEGEEK